MRFLEDQSKREEERMMKLILQQEYEILKESSHVKGHP
jgi:hypothetical protein